MVWYESKIDCNDIFSFEEENTESERTEKINASAIYLFTTSSYHLVHQKETNFFHYTMDDKIL